MLRDEFVNQVTQHGDGRKAIVVDLGGAIVDVEGVRYDEQRNVIVVVADSNDLEGAIFELRKGAGVP